MRKLAAELFGSFALVFAGTGAIVINDVSGGTVSHVGIAFTFGLIVLAMIYALGGISGAHLNPAVTIGFFVSGRFEARWAVPYIFSQCLGAVLASGTLRLMFPSHATLGATMQAGDLAAVDAANFLHLQLRKQETPHIGLLIQNKRSRLAGAVTRAGFLAEQNRPRG